MLAGCGASWNSHALVVGMENGETTFEVVQQFLKALTRSLPEDTVVLVLGISPRGMKTCIYTDFYTIVYDNFIHNGPKLETVQTSISR